MGNMGYCRFENTYGDLRDCFEHIYDQLESETETKSRSDLIDLCCEIALNTGRVEEVDE